MKVAELLKSKYGDIAMRADKAIKPRKRKYATALTKDDLIKRGVVSIDMDTLTVYGVNGPLTIVRHRQGYLMVQLYDVDDNGNRIKIPRKAPYAAADGTMHYYDSYVYKTILIGLHRLLWAWNYGIVESGIVIDHIDNKHDNIEDYRLDNLQAITPIQNIAKEKDGYAKTKLYTVRKPIEFYSDKLNRLKKEYEEAKANHDAKEAHRLRSSIANVKARIRYLLRKNEIQ